jgi:hypothetical protein
MKKVNFFIILMVLLLVFATWLIAQTVLEQVKDSNEISGTDIYDGVKEDNSVILKPATTTSDFCYKDLICLDNLRAEDTIKSPLIITGKASGVWYFEATFPVILTNWDGLIIAEAYASAKDEWMTEDFVDFEVKLEFKADTSVSNRGTLILQKDNPSGLPEFDDALEFTVFFN